MFRKLFPLTILGISSFSALADVINFDDLYTGTESLISSSYAGFNWGPNPYIVNDAWYMGSYYANSYGSPSGQIALFNGHGAQNFRISSVTPFDFNGAMVSTWAYHDGFDPMGCGVAGFSCGGSATSLTIVGYNGSTYIGEVTTPLSSTSYQWVNANFENVTSLNLISSGSPAWWLLDDFTYNESLTNNVEDAGAAPEPSTMALFGLGLIGAVAFYRRNKSK